MVCSITSLICKKPIRSCRKQPPPPHWRHSRYRHIPSLAGRLESESQVAETFHIRLLERQGRILVEIQTGRHAPHTCRERESVGDRQFHVGNSQLGDHAPSSNCTIEWITDSGCTTTSMRSSGKSKSHELQSPQVLIHQVALSTLILRPMLHFGCLTAIAGVMPSSVFRPRNGRPKR